MILYKFNSIYVMQFRLNAMELFLSLKEFYSRITIFNAGLFLIAVNALSIYFPFPLNELFVAFFALFFSGYLFFRLIIKQSPLAETFVLSVVLSMGIIVFFTFILNVSFGFPLEKSTVTSAAIFSNVIFLGIHFIKGVLSE